MLPTEGSLWLLMWRKDSCPLAARWVIGLGDGSALFSSLVLLITRVWPRTAEITTHPMRAKAQHLLGQALTSQLLTIPGTFRR